VLVVRDVMLSVACVAFAMVKDCETWDAGSKLRFPTWLALMVQVPAETTVTVVPETVQTADVAVVKATVKVEVDVADKEDGVVP